MPGEMKEHSAEAETKFEDLVNNNLRVLPELLSRLNEELRKQLHTTMYETISNACERTGNVVDAKTKASLEEAFLEMLEKIEFSVGRDGSVSMPQMHMGPDAFKKFTEMAARETPEFAAKVEEIKGRKVREAHEREAARRQRFVRYGE
jgi:hypothetical protein